MQPTHTTISYLTADFYTETADRLMTLSDKDPTHLREVLYDIHLIIQIYSFGPIPYSVP